jgi:hypothetical protein
MAEVNHHGRSIVLGRLGRGQKVQTLNPPLANILPLPFPAEVRVPLLELVKGMGRAQCDELYFPVLQVAGLRNHDQARPSQGLLDGLGGQGIGLGHEKREQAIRQKVSLR